MVVGPACNPGNRLRHYSLLCTHFWGPASPPCQRHSTGPGCPVSFLTPHPSDTYWTHLWIFPLPWGSVIPLSCFSLLGPSSPDTSESPLISILSPEHTCQKFKSLLAYSRSLGQFTLWRFPTCAFRPEHLLLLIFRLLPFIHLPWKPFLNQKIDFPGRTAYPAPGLAAFITADKKLEARAIFVPL